MPSSPSSSPSVRLERLRAALPATIEFLQRRRADLIDPVLIDDYVAINWFEWHGGALRLTVTGRNICAQLAIRAR
ncbi:hypothetical protein [Sphaerotilus uruguayifluvii]|uniref:Uncharacterized protein n=1 Tax=Sphaerotilus uruguayifluvii TaxID=2735897 RepID=A0ABX2G5F4_9BURK|nr:hypothetical protein [Leptothrix sp. C29]